MRPPAPAPMRPARSRRAPVPGRRPDLARAAPAIEAHAVCRGAVRLLEGLGFRTLVEMRLASGRRVDAIGLDGRGRFAVVEVKTSLADLRADDKWPDYLPFADLFYFALPPGFRLAAVPEDAGIIVADRYAGEIVRASPLVPMATARRRTQTLLFARTASARLCRLAESGL
jgi:hypothetical protein